jgi:hypothetical protein
MVAQPGSGEGRFSARIPSPRVDSPRGHRVRGTIHEGDRTVIKKTVVAGIAALAVAGVLGGAALTSAAGADTPRTATAASDVTAQASKGFNMFNSINVDLQLIGVEGNHEGVPPIGSTMTNGQFQRFEVQYPSSVRATFKIIDPNWGNSGTFQIEMQFHFFGDVNAYVVWNNSTMPGIAITHPGDETWGITYA